MVEKVVIEVSGQAQLQSTIDQLVKVGAVDAKNAEQFKKNNQQFTAETQKNIERVLVLQKSVEQLQYALTRAQNPKQVEILNRALAEQSQRLMEAVSAAKTLEYQIDRTVIAEAKLAAEAKRANEILIVEQRRAAQQAETLVQKLIRIGVVEEKNAEDFKKNASNLTAKSQQNINKVVMLQKSVDQLGYALAKAENPAQVRALNVALAEQNRRLISATEAAKKLEYQTAKQTSPAVGFLKNQFAGVGAAIAGAFAVTQLISFGKEAVNLAAKGEGIRRAFAALNQADLLKNLQEATRNTVADIDLMAAAVKANNFKIPLEDLARYFKFAQQRARETGESVDYLVESIVLGIGRKSPLILDNLGISAVELRAKLKGIGTETASVGQIGDAVGQIIDEQLTKQGVMLDTTADKLARLEAGWKNFMETAGVALIDFADLASKSATMVDAGMISVADAIERERARIDENISKSTDAAIEQIKRRTEAAKNLENANKTEIDTVGVLLERIKALQEEYKDVSTPEQYAAITAKIKTVQEQLEKIIGKTTEKIKEQKKARKEDLPTEMLENMAEGQRQAAQKRIDDEKKTADAIAANEAELMKHINNLHRAQDEKDKAASDERVRIAEEEARRKEQIEKAVFDAMMQLTSMYFDLVQQQNQADTDNLLNQLQTQLDAREITQEQYNESRKRILTQQAKDNKANAIFEAAIMGAVAVVESLPNVALAAITAALVLAEIAAISAAPIPQFEKGGRIKGKRHRDGGTVIEAEEGEFVINRKAAKKIGFDNLEALNRGAVPPKLLKQGLSETKNKMFENRLINVLGSSDFDTYPIEKELRKSRKNDTQIAQMIVKSLGKTKQKRGY